MHKLHVFKTVLSIFVKAGNMWLYMRNVYESTCDLNIT